MGRCWGERPNPSGWAEEHFEEEWGVGRGKGKGHLCCCTHGREGGGCGAQGTVEGVTEGGDEASSGRAGEGRWGDLSDNGHRIPGGVCGELEDAREGHGDVGRGRCLTVAEETEVGANSTSREERWASSQGRWHSTAPEPLFDAIFQNSDVIIMNEKTI